ncbi:hypothetical protein [Rosistilla oblonga]|uniref:hypothetical protein n=1 Tax=Rosistilla oblonga TaxID=2527990 RepID=UPI003A97529B
MTTNPYAPPNAEDEHGTLPVTNDVAVQLMRPAAAIIFLAVVNLGFDLYGLAEDIFFPTTSRLPTLGVPELTILGTIHTLQAMGGIQMRSMGSYRLAHIGALTCCIPCMSPFWILGMPFGVWTVRILSQPESKVAFGRRVA